MVGRRRWWWGVASVVILIVAVFVWTIQLKVRGAELSGDDPFPFFSSSASSNHMSKLYQMNLIPM